jgi:hypothetical protein
MMGIRAKAAPVHTYIARLNMEIADIINFFAALMLLHDCSKRSQVTGFGLFI